MCVIAIVFCVFETHRLCARERVRSRTRTMHGARACLKRAATDGWVRLRDDADNVSYIYHSMYAYFSRDNVALEGFAKHFEKESLEERAHAQQLMDYQNLRGGKVILQQLLPPQSEFDHPEKGCALYALELALSLEKLNLDKLRELYVVADDANDAALCDFLEGEMLAPQIASIREVAEMVATLKRMGPPGDGMAAWHFDQTLRA